MKTILVTGAKGFIGSALTQALKKLNYHVITFDSSDGDITQTSLINKYETANIAHIFHLAAKTFVPESWKHPGNFYNTSIMGTTNVLELCREQNASLTFLSSYLYGETSDLPIKETHPIKPNNPYAHSKYMAEELCQFYAQNFDVNTTVIRPFNVYGKNQKKDFLIPHIINQILHADSIQVKTLSPKRDYIYLDDLVNGLIRTLHSKRSFAVYNIGSSKAYTVEEAINIIQKILHTSKKIISEQTERNNEISTTLADISKAKDELDWQPSYSFEEGLKQTILELQNEH